MAKKQNSDADYDEGWADGYDEGGADRYEEGHKFGHAEGRTAGYAEGYAAGQPSGLERTLAVIGGTFSIFVVAALLYAIIAGVIGGIEYLNRPAEIHQIAQNTFGDSEPIQVCTQNSDGNMVCN